MSRSRKLAWRSYETDRLGDGQTALAYDFKPNAIHEVPSEHLMIPDRSIKTKALQLTNNTVPSRHRLQLQGRRREENGKSPHPRVASSVRRLKGDRSHTPPLAAPWPPPLLPGQRLQLQRRPVRGRGWLARCPAPALGCGRLGGSGGQLISRGPVAGWAGCSTALRAHT